MNFIGRVARIPQGEALNALAAGGLALAGASAFDLLPSVDIDPVGVGVGTALAFAPANAFERYGIKPMYVRGAGAATLGLEGARILANAATPAYDSDYERNPGIAILAPGAFLGGIAVSTPEGRGRLAADLKKLFATDASAAAPRTSSPPSILEIFRSLDDTTAVPATTTVSVAPAAGTTVVAPTAATTAAPTTVVHGAAIPVARVDEKSQITIVVPPDLDEKTRRAWKFAAELLDYNETLTRKQISKHPRSMLREFLNKPELMPNAFRDVFSQEPLLERLPVSEWYSPGMAPGLKQMVVVNPYNLMVPKLMYEKRIAPLLTDMTPEQIQEFLRGRMVGIGVTSLKEGKSDMVDQLGVPPGTLIPAKSLYQDRHIFSDIIRSEPYSVFSMYKVPRIRTGLGTDLFNRGAAGDTANYTIFYRNVSR